MSKAFDGILAGLEEAKAYTEGKKTNAVTHKLFQADVKAIRKKTGMTQQKFADTFCLSVKTVRNWEQGIRRPEGPAAALMTIIDRDPDTAMKALAVAPE